MDAWLYTFEAHVRGGPCLNPASSMATRDAVTLVFQAFSHYAGTGVGEGLGYLLTSL